MQFEQEVTVFGIKASKGVMEQEGRASMSYDSTTFHILADLKANSSGPSLGQTTTPQKCGDSSEFDKWKHLEKAFPIKAIASFEIQANGKGDSNLVMTAIRPMERAPKAA